MFFLENARAERPHNVSSLGQAKPFLQTDTRQTATTTTKFFFFSRGKFRTEETIILGVNSFIYSFNKVNER